MNTKGASSYRDPEPAYRFCLLPSLDVWIQTPERQFYRLDDLLRGSDGLWYRPLVALRALHHALASGPLAPPEAPSPGS